MWSWQPTSTWRGKLVTSWSRRICPASWLSSSLRCLSGWTESLSLPELSLVSLQLFSTSTGGVGGLSHWFNGEVAELLSNYDACKFACNLSLIWSLSFIVHTSYLYSSVKMISLACSTMLFCTNYGSCWKKKRQPLEAISHWRVERRSHFLVSRWLPGNSTALTE